LVWVLHHAVLAQLGASGWCSSSNMADDALLPDSLWACHNCHLRVIRTVEVLCIRPNMVCSSSDDQGLDDLGLCLFVMGVVSLEGLCRGSLFPLLCSLPDGWSDYHLHDFKMAEWVRL
jgi:hypothetical protein